MAATSKLTGTYEGPDSPFIKRNDPIEVVGFEHDKNGQAVVWIVANERIRVVFAKDVRVK